MKYFVMVLGILGALASIFLGSRWLSDYNQAKPWPWESSKSVIGQAEPEPLLESVLPEIFGVDKKIIKGIPKAAYILIIGGCLSFIFCLLFLSRIPKLSGAVMLLSSLTPVYFYPKAFYFTFSLLIAGVLALFISPKKAKIKTSMKKF